MRAVSVVDGHQIGERVVGQRGGEAVEVDLLRTHSTARSSGALGVSTITVVALTTATAKLPGSSFTLPAACVLIKDTTLCGPHCISTCVMTVSLSTFLVTSEVNRFRAELPMPSGLAGDGCA